VMVGATRTTETASASAVVVAVVADAPPASLTLPPGGVARFMASFCTSLDESDPVAAATAAYVDAMGVERRALWAAHAAEWAQLWSSGVDVDGGRLDVARAINASLYYILSSIRSDAPHSLSPGGLASNSYNGHTFWDTETWMYPPLLVWHPDVARSVLEYRHIRLNASRAKAAAYDPPYDGAMFAWESATGAETCPLWADTGVYEQHITGDIAFAAKQYYDVTADEEWLAGEGYDILEASATFWTSKAAHGADDAGGLHIRQAQERRERERRGRKEIRESEESKEEESEGDLLCARASSSIGRAHMHLAHA
jgi:protein-glucosylgalactosylhydroxylysine glucosidase